MRIVAGLFGVLLGASCVPPPDPPLPFEDAGTAPDIGVLGDLGQPDTQDSGMTPVPDAGMVQTMEVSHERELRAVWIATVANINFPSQPGLSAGEQQAELVGMLDLVAQLGLNAVVFQVRPEGDALYESTLEPWSRFLTGTQGGDPGYDPLSFLLTEAHARNIEVHAWFNPYRLKSSASSSAVMPHFSVTNPESTRSYGNFVWMDPGDAMAREHTRAVIVDVVRRYDIDGVHFDDYFYPYPNGEQFPDSESFADYQASGGTLSREDWRRDNVNQMVQQVFEAVRQEKPHVRFGISPFGIYRPGIPEGIVGLDQYAEIFADPVTWMDNGWVDYLAPQLYWPSTQTRQAYEPLIQWWSSIASGGRYIFAGNYLSQLGSSDAWTIDEFRTQVALGRARRDLGSMGNIYFHIGPLQTDQDGIAGMFQNELYDRPAVTPRLSAAEHQLSVPAVNESSGQWTLSHEAPGSLRAYLIYEIDPDGTNLISVLSASSGVALDVQLEPGAFAISAVDKSGVESLGVIVSVP